MIQAVPYTDSGLHGVSDSDRRWSDEGYSERWTFNGHGAAVLKFCRRKGSHPRRFECSESVLMAAITEAHVSRQPVARGIGNRLAILATPIRSTVPPEIGVQYIECEGQQALELIQQLARQNARLTISESLLQSELRDREQQLCAYAAQVSEDLEEVTWLRSLAANLELSESGNSIERIAESVLPALCKLIRASTILFVRDVPMTGISTPLPVIWQSGRIKLTRDQCLSIVNEYREIAADQPFVCNTEGRHDGPSLAAGLTSCIVVPVANSFGRLGWLIAANKEAEVPRSTSDNPAVVYRTHMSEEEFGSFEASLMSATAVILAAHGRNCRLFHEKELLLRGVIRSMINAIDAKDSYTCGHSDRVAEFARQIARELSLSATECEEIYMAGLLHDVGKIGVPDHVLKKPGRLTDEEFELIKKHPVIGYEILKHLDNLKAVLPGVLHHHEAVDGSGYPHGLVGDAIPLSARILAVADSYDAMTSNRPYRRGMPTEKAESILRDGAGTQWDVACINAFFRTIHGIRIAACRPAHAAPGAIPELV